MTAARGESVRGLRGAVVPKQGISEGWEELTAPCLQWHPVPTCTRGSAEPVPLCEPLPSLCPALAGQFLWDVDAGLPAERAGMKEGDRVLAVNGESIEGLDHEQTVRRIRARDDQVTLLVIDPAGDEFYHSVGFGALAGEPWGAVRLHGEVGAHHSGCVSIPLLFFQIGLSPLQFFEDSDPASGSCTPSLLSGRGSPALCDIEVGPKGPVSWLMAAANSIEIIQVTP